ncbi:biotin/lipoyl-containing protein [Planctomicrobium sp. SH664]|uniref:biotin/lipoyl-containing protein n=1 Tax=Planctomicrobium sp. SH664 TaxID=3448125 RepID=UPI003F5B58EA
MDQDPFPNSPVDVTLPEVGAGAEPIRFVTWLVPEGARVIPGERIAELVTQGIVWQLDASTYGRIGKFQVHPGRIVQAGDVLAQIEPEDD